MSQPATEQPSLLDISDQISTARNFVELIHMAHNRFEDAATGQAASHVTDLLQGAIDMLKALIKPQTPGAEQ